MIPLTVRCPFCSADLMDSSNLLDGYPSIRMHLKVGRQEGDLRLSCLYGSFRYSTRVKVSDGDETELFCPHCRRSLLTDVACEICKAPMVKLRLIVDGDVYFCSRKGCKNHKVELRDLEAGLAEFYGYITGEEPTKQTLGT